MKKVLFVCVHNSGRSQMAKAFFNHMAGEKALAFSAGTQPAENVNPVVIEVIREIGIDLSHRIPRALTLEMIEQADRVITMGCGAEATCPATFVQSEDWALEDPTGKTLDEVRKIREQIKSRVVKLLKEIT